MKQQMWAGSCGMRIARGEQRPMAVHKCTSGQSSTEECSQHTRATPVQQGVMWDGPIGCTEMTHTPQNPNSKWNNAKGSGFGLLGLGLPTCHHMSHVQKTFEQSGVAHDNQQRCCCLLHVCHAEPWLPGCSSERLWRACLASLGSACALNAHVAASPSPRMTSLPGLPTSTSTSHMRWGDM